MQRVRIDIWYTAILVLIIGVGLTMGYSAGSAESIMRGQGTEYLLKKQLLFTILGIVAAYAVASISYQYVLERFKWVIWAMNIVNFSFLLMSYIPAFQVVGNGAGRWVNLGGFQFQPSEITKVVAIITMSYLVARAREAGAMNKWTSWKEGLVPILAYLCANLGLVFLQKHLSATALIAGVSIVILYMGGLKNRFLIFFIGVCSVLGVVAIALEPYRLKRIVGFLHPEEHMDEEGWQIVQGWYALGSGGWNGLGLGMSRQKFGWIPEHHTDYIVGMIGEEIGFIGMVAIMILFFLLLLRGYMLADQVNDFCGKAIMTGVQTLIFMQFGLNLLIVSGLFPPTGVPVPFISFGGSSTVVLYLAVGLIYNVYTANNKYEERKA